MTTYYIDRYNIEAGDHEEIEHWKNLDFDQVNLVLEHTDFEEGYIYCLCEYHGPEDVARWTSTDQALINAWLEYETEKSIFSNIHD